VEAPGERKKSTARFRRRIKRPKKKHEKRKKRGMVFETKLARRCHGSYLTISKVRGRAIIPEWETRIEDAGPGVAGKVHKKNRIVRTSVNPKKVSSGRTS